MLFYTDPWAADRTTQSLGRWWILPQIFGSQNWGLMIRHRPYLLASALLGYEVDADEQGRILQPMRSYDSLSYSLYAALERYRRFLTLSS